ncbi:hypothetical protein ONS95_005707 [Cadophora gregata]|uniref:uncharacterized protein n=2 Tax=Cadophora gregata TaxID=51156 RepID=UPI0026DC04A0|nr:uncharacterized protein ONS95_005707 [Cadophora gregata]KAK0103699.1 hypothetical protein ONS95_005707 [Cadophora gregata]
MSSTITTNDLLDPLVQEVTLSPGSSPLFTPQGPASVTDQRPRLVSVQSTKSVAFDPSAQQDTSHRNNTPEQLATPPRSSGDKRKSIYWRSPASMVACFFLGVFVALGHHLYYTSLKGDLVGDEDEQQRKLRYGTTFAFVTQVSLVGSVGFAYSQWLWKTLRATTVSVQCLDSAFSADTQLISMFNPEMWWKIKLGSVLALLAWCLQLPSLITPATLGVVPGTQAVNTSAEVPRLLISTNDTGQYSRFEYSAPLLPDTVEGLNDTNNFFVGPRTIISRLSSATATTGQIQSIYPPFTNSSYSLQFFGPTVKCEEANSTQAGIIDRLLKLKMSHSRDNFSEQTSAYFGFVPNEYIINGGEVTDIATVNEISDIRMQRPANTSSNQLWTTYQRYVWDSIGNRSTVVHHTVCRLFNASYDVNFDFQAGNQIIQKNTELGILNEIKYPADDPQTPTNYAAHSYTAFMWVVTDQLVGSMGFWIDNTTNRKFSSISTPIEHNSLLGSVDLDPFFDYNDALYRQNSTTANKTMSDQRREDKDLAKNKTLNALIEELSFNVTISFMSSNLLSPKVNTTVLRTTTLNVYTYKSTSLFLAYGLAILTSLLANILGIIAYISNGSAHDRNFSAILGATRERELSHLFDEKNHGILPVPKPTKMTLLKFRDMDDGGWSFRKEEKKIDPKDWKALMDRRTSVVKKSWNWSEAFGLWKTKTMGEKRG